MWWFGRKGRSGYSSSSTAEEVTEGINGSSLTAIVTGASSGIGTETARVLSLRGVHVVMGVRNMKTGEEVKKSIINEIPSAKIDAMELDLSSMASVTKFAKEYTSSGRPLNILINNAGIMATPFMLSKDKIELQFATNHIVNSDTSTKSFSPDKSVAGHNEKNIPQIQKEGRIVNVSSEAHRYVYREGVRFDKLNDQKRYNRFAAYGQSKLANVLHANELSRRLKEDRANITANSLHPGMISTNLFRYNNFAQGLLSNIGKYVLKNVQQGAATTCYVALHPQVKGVSGEYFLDSNLSKASDRALNIDLAKKLWDFSANLVKK